MSRRAPHRPVRRGAAAANRLRLPKEHQPRRGPRPRLSLLWPDAASSLRRPRSRRVPRIHLRPDGRSPHRRSRSFNHHSLFSRNVQPRSLPPPRSRRPHRTNLRRINSRHRSRASNPKARPRSQPRHRNRPMNPRLLSPSLVGESRKHRRCRRISALSAPSRPRHCVPPLTSPRYRSAQPPAARDRQVARSPTMRSDVRIPSVDCSSRLPVMKRVPPTDFTIAGLPTTDGRQRPSCN